MFLDSFRVLIESFADSDSWMTPLEALRALHISEIGSFPVLHWHTVTYRGRTEIEDFQKFSNFEICHSAHK